METSKECRAVGQDGMCFGEGDETGMLEPKDCEHLGLTDDFLAALVQKKNPLSDIMRIMQIFMYAWQPRVLRAKKAIAITGGTDAGVAPSDRLMTAMEIG